MGFSPNLNSWAHSWPRNFNDCAEIRLHYVNDCAQTRLAVWGRADGILQAEKSCAAPPSSQPSSYLTCNAMQSAICTGYNCAISPVHSLIHCTLDCTLYRAHSAIVLCRLYTAMQCPAWKDSILIHCTVYSSLCALYNALMCAVSSMEDSVLLCTSLYSALLCSVQHGRIR